MAAQTSRTLFGSEESAAHLACLQSVRRALDGHAHHRIERRGELVAPAVKRGAHPLTCG